MVLDNHIDTAGIVRASAKGKAGGGPHSPVATLVRPDIPSHPIDLPHNSHTIHPPHPIKQARADGGLAWVLNPCRVSYEAFDVRDKDDGGTQWSAVAYATAGRHLIAGAWMDGRVECV